MTLFVIITNKLYFSQEIIKYFKTQNMCNTFNFVFLPIGLDQGSEKEILKIINDRVNELKKKAQKCYKNLYMSDFCSTFAVDLRMW